MASIRPLSDPWSYAGIVPFVPATTGKIVKSTDEFLNGAKMVQDLSSTKKLAEAAEQIAPSSGPKVSKFNSTAQPRHKPPSDGARSAAEQALRDQARDAQSVLGDRLEELGLPRDRIPTHRLDGLTEDLIEQVFELQRDIGRLRQNPPQNPPRPRYPLE
jgi:hypothetical protein